MKTILDALKCADRITVKPSAVVIRLSEDFPISDLSGFGFYCSGELYAGKLYLHCDLKAFLRAVCVSAMADPSKVVRYEKPKAR